MTAKSISTILAKQRDFYASGQTRSLTFRLEQLQQLERLLRENESALLEALALDLGKSASEAYMTEIGLLYRSLATMKRNLKKWSRQQRVKTPLYLWPARSYTLASPYGRILIISPFNYPLLLSLDPLLGALAGGNVALVALSEYTPHVNHVLIEASQAYFKEEFVYFFTGSKALNTEVLKQPFDKVFFTGSTQVGQVVLAAASKHLTPVTLELGGKSPALITKEADVALAAERVAWGKFLNVGQTCVAPDYCLVDREVVAEFTTQLELKIKEYYGTDASQSPDYGRIIHAKHVDRLADLLLKDRDFLVSGGAVLAAERYIEPTLLRGTLTTELASMEAEIFGPILPIISYDHLTEAVAFIEARPAPLAFYPFSRNKAELENLLGRLQFGGATTNDTVLHLTNDALPFGGVRHSGMGSYHGQASFTCFTQQKSVLARQNFLALKLMYPPYGLAKDKIIRRFLR